MRIAHSFAATAALLTLSFTSEHARAQTTDPKKISDARELANAGIQLQNDRRYAECSEKFAAAHKLYPEATSITIRLAQCLVADGKLVEGSEAYRELASTKVPADAPVQFKDAQARGKGEAEQVNQLIPTITIAVDPTPPPAGTQLHMQRINPNGAPPTAEVLEAAWIGTPRKVNPGEYTIFATAPGYASKPISLTVAQSKKESVRLLLSAGEATPAPTGNETRVAGPSEQPEQPPAYETQPAPSGKQATKYGLLLGLGGGASVGTFAGSTGDPGPMGHLNFYARISKFTVGAVVQYDALLNEYDNLIGSLYLGVHAGLLTTAERKVALWLDGGLGARFVGGTDDRYQGFSAQFGIGPSFPLHRVIRLIPKAYFAVGGAPAGGHALAGLSLDLQFEIPLGKKPGQAKLAPRTYASAWNPLGPDSR